MIIQDVSDGLRTVIYVRNTKPLLLECSVQPTLERQKISSFRWENHVTGTGE
jgi:hypothetical protein